MRRQSDLRKVLIFTHLGEQIAKKEHSRVRKLLIVLVAVFAAAADADARSNDIVAVFAVIGSVALVHDDASNDDLDWIT